MHFVCLPVTIITALFIISIQPTYGTLNFYLNNQEVKKLLGLEAELFYVREGIVNNYALNFIIPVPSKINHLHFTWESLSNKPLPYVIDVETNDHEALDKPTLNITRSGRIPTETQIFSIALPCNGLLAAEIDVIINLNVTIASNIIILQLQRKRICSKLDSSIYNDIVDAVPIRPESSRIFYYAVVCAVILATSSIMCVTGLYIRSKKQRRSTQEINANQTYSAFLPNTIRNNTTSSSYSSFRRMPSYSLIEERVSSKTIQERICELSIQRCRVSLQNVIMEGTFGRIYKGNYTSEGGAEDVVLVKTVTSSASQIQISLLLQEGLLMYSLNHQNILSILGVSLEDTSAPFLLYPLNNYTNLKGFLQRCKLCSEGVAHTLTTQEVVSMALQIIEAMHYMHKKHILHKDLATRNCVVDNKLKIKVADNALSRDLYPSDYHCLGDNENRPIKWLALESLINKSFSSRSEVWSFGVLLWELTTLAQQPYVEIDPFEMGAYLKDGYRLAQPINCPDELFAVMAYCWAMNPEDRPTFLQLEVCLKEFYMQLTRYV